MKNRLIGIGIIVFSLLGGFFAYRFYQNYRIQHATKIVEYSSEIEVYQNIKLKKLITNINGTLLENKKIDTKKLGKQEITFEYINNENIKIPYTIEIEVVDKTPPIISQQSLYSVTVGTNTKEEIEKSLFCGDNYDKSPTCTIIGEVNPNQVGDYPVTFMGKDSSGNTSSHNLTIRIKNPSPKSNSTTYPTSYTDFQEVIQKYKTEKTKIGIDVSHWQGDINFQKVKESGVEFVYIRVGRGDGIGKDYVEDTKFQQNIKGFNDVGIPVGVYFYSNANSEEDAIKEAKWVLSKIKKYKVDLEIAFDWENWQDFQEFNQSFYSLTDTFKAFSKTVEAKEYSSLLYSSKNYLETVWYPTTRKKWLAHYTEQTNYKGAYQVWQICNDGKVNGISDNLVDINVMYTS